TTCAPCRPAPPPPASAAPPRPPQPQTPRQPEHARFAMSSRCAYRHTRHDLRISERPAAVLRDAWFRPAARPAPRWPDDHRPQFRAVAGTLRGEQAGDRGGTPGPRAHRRYRPPDDDPGAGW